MTIASPLLPDYTTQGASTYKGLLDGALKAFLLLAGRFAPRADVQFDFTSAKVSAANDTITREGHTLVNDDIVRLTTTGTLPAPFALATDYYVVQRTEDTFKLSTSQGGAAVNITDGGSGIHTATRTRNMTVGVAQGILPKVGALPTLVAAQKTAAITAPTTNPRNDIVHIDASSGAVGVTTGVEAASPSDPTPAAGKIPVARVRTTVGMTQITNADLDDLRSVILAGLADALAGSGLTAASGKLTATSVSAATQAEMESASSTSVYSSPGRQHFHPGHPKAWVYFKGTGTVTINADYGVSSITDVGTGQYTVNFDTAFSSANYAWALSSALAGGFFTNRGAAPGAAPNAGNFSILTGLKSASTVEDHDHVSAVFFGDL